MTVRVSVVLSPAEELPEADCWMVIDILRATTTMAVFFERGGTCLYPASSVEEGIALRDTLASGGERAPLLMGERNALPPSGFDLGNSPLELLKMDLSHLSTAVMATTNGTRALLKAAANGRPVRPVCACNASAVLDASLSSGERLGIYCAGRMGRAALDDTACAGILVELLLKRGKTELDDGAQMARAVWRDGGRDLPALLADSDHGKTLFSLGFEEDIRYAGQIDSSTAVCRLGTSKTLPALFPEGGPSNPG